MPGHPLHRRDRASTATPSSATQLMDQHGVQINKTSRNTVLFMTNIGTTRSSVAYLIEVLVKIARELDDQAAEMSLGERAAYERAVLQLTNPSAPLPRLQRVPPRFLESRVTRQPQRVTSVGHFSCPTTTPSASTCRMMTSRKRLRRGEIGRLGDVRHAVSARLSRCWCPARSSATQILSFMRSLDTPEVHGYAARTRLPRLHRQSAGDRLREVRQLKSFAMSC